MSAVADPVGSAVFRLATPACPAAVWAALTCAATTPRWLYGLSLSSPWTAGAPLLGWLSTEAPAVSGTVLFADAPERLTYSLDDASGGVTYVAWRVREAACGSVVRLTVEEPGATEDDIEDVWLPVLGALAEVLAAPAETPAG